MAYVPTSPQLGLQPIASTSTTPVNDPGSVIRARDPVYGEGEFIYLKGAASTVVGSVVTWGGATTGTPNYQTTLAPATAGLAQPVAVAMSANLAGSWGWYQISGAAVAATNGTLVAGPGPLYLAGSGQLTSSQAAGKQVSSATNLTATGTPAAGLAVIQMDRSAAQGQIL